MGCIRGLRKHWGGKSKRRRQTGHPAPASHAASVLRHTPPADPPNSHQGTLSKGVKAVNPDYIPQPEVSTISETHDGHSANVKHTGIVQQDVCTAKLPEPCSLWNQALDQLSVKETKTIRDLIPSEGQLETQAVDDGNLSAAIDAAIEAMRQHGKKYEESSQTELRDRTIKIIKHLTQAGNFASGFTPSIAQQLWPIAKWLLQIPVTAAEQMTELLKIADHVSHAAVLGCAYETYFDENSTSQKALGPLRQGLLKVYTCALQLLAMGAHLLGQSGLARVFLSVYSLDDMKEKASELSDLLQRLNSCVTAAESDKTFHRDARLRLFMEKWEVSMTGVENNVRELGTNTNSEKVEDVLDWVSNVTVDDDQRPLKESRVPETCEWILEHPEFKNWESSRQGALVWLQGAGQRPFRLSPTTSRLN